MVQLCE